MVEKSPCLAAVGDTCLQKSRLTGDGYDFTRLRNKNCSKGIMHYRLFLILPIPMAAVLQPAP
jgi:hypothetical protein